MTSSGDFYAMLGVPRDAEAKTIKNAFRQLARRYHPDTSTEPDAKQRFKEIAEAYAVLSDPARRASYDAQGPLAWPGPPQKTCGAASTSPTSSGLERPYSATCSSGCSGRPRRARRAAKTCAWT